MEDRDKWRLQEKAEEFVTRCPVQVTHAASLESDESRLSLRVYMYACQGARKALCHLQKEKTVVSKWVRDYSRPNCPFDPFRLCWHTPLHAKAGESLLLSTASTGTDFSDGLPVRRRLAALCTVQVLRHE